MTISFFPLGFAEHLGKKMLSDPGNSAGLFIFMTKVIENVCIRHTLSMTYARGPFMGNG